MTISEIPRQCEVGVREMRSQGSINAGCQYSFAVQRSKEDYVKILYRGPQALVSLVLVSRICDLTPRPDNHVNPVPSAQRDRGPGDDRRFGRQLEIETWNNSGNDEHRLEIHMIVRS